MPIQTINPATGEVIKTYDTMSDEQINTLIDKAHRSFQDWGKRSFKERGTLIANAGKILEDNLEEYAQLITLEMGKCITEARREIKKCAAICMYYAEHAERYLQPRTIKTEMQKSFVCYRPQGVIFSIMPWNFPFWQVFRFAAPNITAGNVGMLSHAPISTGAALAIQNIFRKAGFPEGVFTALLIEVPQAAKIIAHPKIFAVTLTGSERAGKAVGSEAGQNLKKVVLELGGSDPYLILDDADIEHAANVCVSDRMMCSGQVCISAKRLIAVDAIYDQFEQRVLEEMKKYQPSDPRQDDCNFGPMARSDLRDGLDQQVQDSIAKGAKCLMGGKKVAGPGFFYAPTVLSNVQAGMPAYDQELFGPVVSLIRAKNEADAIRIANDSPYGLGAAVFTKDLKKGEDIAANKLDAGTCVVNTSVGSDPRLPFGGVKLSGYGRECAEEGIREFMNVKTVSIK